MDETQEFEARILFVTAKSRLIEIVGTHPDEGRKFFLPKSCTIDFNVSHLEEKLHLFVVKDWWYKKRYEFEAQD